MDSTTKMRKGFMKGKLVMSFYRAAKPPPPTTTTTKVKTTTGHKKAPPPPSSLIMNQEKVTPQPYKHKVSYVVPQTTGTYGMFDNPYGVAVDEAVDAKAASYISCVQERFKLDHVNTAEWVEPAS